MPNTHRFTVGDITCIVLHEGGGPTSMENMMQRYPGVSEAEIKAAMEALNYTNPVGSLNCLYIDTGDTKIVADTGFGESRRPEMGQVVPALQVEGVQPEDIDIVYITHFHGDHIVGLTNNDGSYAFPNARYVTADAEWKEWMPKWEQSDEDSHKQLHSMMSGIADKFTYVNDGDKVVPGVSAVLIAGHTLGQTGLLVESNGESLLHLADLLHSQLQFANPHWHFTFDTDADLAVESRRAQLERCANNNILTLFYHLEFPGLGHVGKAGDAYTWQPLGGLGFDAGSYAE